MFADIAGFTSRSERMDPEDVRRMLDAYYRVVRRELLRHGGTIAKFIGDGVMALFGAPIAHEDDPERGVRAALALRDAIAAMNQDDRARDLHLRIGVVTGEVLVTMAGGSVDAVGDMVNVAARLESAAPRDSVLVDAATRAATGDSITYQQHEPVRAKGKSEPVEAWVATRAARGTARNRRHSTPLAGRTRELSAVTRTLESVRSSGTSALATVIGLPGIGKSRLIWEARLAAESSPEPPRWLSGATPSYGDDAPHRAVGEIVSAFAGITSVDEPGTQAAKLGAAVASVCSDGAEAAWLEGLLRPLVSPASPAGEHRPEEAPAGWRAFVRALAADRPTVLVFEDIHWADETLLDFLEGIADAADGVPLAIICTARPQLLERRPGWPAAIALEQLGSDEMAELLSALGTGGSGGDLASRAGGNPLYAEEYARLLADQAGGDGELPTPASVHGITAARIDSLPVEDRALVGAVAVVGETFWAGAAAAVAGDGDVRARLERLEQRGFIRRSDVSLVPGEAQYEFHHVVLQEVAYGRLPRAGRAELHGRAGRWVDASADLPDLAVHQFSRALALLAELGDPVPDDVASPARRVLRGAGDAAIERGDYQRSRALYGRALGIWPEDDADRLSVEFGYAISEGISEVSAPDLLASCATRLEAAGRLEDASEALEIMSVAAFHHGDPAACDRYQTRSAELLEGRPPSRARVRQLTTLARARALHFTDPAAGLAIADEALTVATELGSTHDIVTAEHCRALCLVVGRHPEGLAHLEAALRRARSQHNLRMDMLIASDLAMIYLETGRLDDGARVNREAAAVARTLGLPDELDVTRMTAQFAFWSGDWERSRELFEIVREASEVGRTDAVLFGARMQLAEHRGSSLRAQADEIAAIADAVEDVSAKVEARSVLARVQAVQGLAQEARMALAEVDALASQGLMMSSLWLADAAFAAHALGVEAGLLARAFSSALPGLWVDAAQAITRGDMGRAAGIFAEIGSRPDEAHARALLADGQPSGRR